MLYSQNWERTSPEMEYKVEFLGLTKKSNLYRKSFAMHDARQHREKKTNALKKTFDTGVYSSFPVHIELSQYKLKTRIRCKIHKNILAIKVISIYYNIKKYLLSDSINAKWTILVAHTTCITGKNYQHIGTPTYAQRLLFICQIKLTKIFLNALHLFAFLWSDM